MRGLAGPARVLRRQKQMESFFGGKGLEMPDREQRTAIFSRMDNNGSGSLSLAEIDKAVAELWPQFDHKKALMRAYTAADVNGDGFIRRREFRLLLKYIIYFNELWEKFDAIDTNHDHRLDLAEFSAGAGLLGIRLSGAEAEAEFFEMDADGGGMALFDEFCTWAAKRQVAVAGEGITEDGSAPGSCDSPSSPSKRVSIDAPPELSVSSRATARAVRERRASADSPPAITPPGPVYHRRLRHPLRSSREEAAVTTRGGFGTSQPRETLIHQNNHPHVSRQSGSPRGADARKSPLRDAEVRKSPPRRGLAGLSASAAPASAGSPAAISAPLDSRSASPPQHRRSPSPPNVHTGVYKLNKQERTQREHANILRVIQQAMAAKRSLHGHSLSDSRAVFSAIDRDASGTLDETELGAAMQRLGLGLTPDQIQCLARALDRDGDGTVDHEELLSYLHGDSHVAPAKGFDEHGFDQKAKAEVLPEKAPTRLQYKPAPVQAPQQHSVPPTQDAGTGVAGSASGAVSDHWCAYLMGAFVAGLCTAVAVIMLLGSDRVGAQALRRGILQELQNPPGYDLADLWEEGYGAAEHVRRPSLAIIGGSGPEAGLDLAAKVVAASRRQMAALPGHEKLVGDLAAPRFSLLSVPELGLSMDLDTHEERVWSSLRDSYLELAGAPAPNYGSWSGCPSNDTCAAAAAAADGRGHDDERADVIAIACITLYHFEPRLTALRAELLRSPLRMLAAPPPKLMSGVAAVGRRLRTRVPAATSVALLGSTVTMDLGAGGRSPFNCGAGTESEGVVSAAASGPHCGEWTYEVPEAAAQERVHALIRSIKREETSFHGGSWDKQQLKGELLELIEAMSSEIVLLACTELPLLLTEEEDSKGRGDAVGEIRYGGKTLIDVTAVLAEELASRVLPVPAAVAVGDGDAGDGK